MPTQVANTADYVRKWIFNYRRWAVWVWCTAGAVLSVFLIPATGVFALWPLFLGLPLGFLLAFRRARWAALAWCIAGAVLGIFLIPATGVSALWPLFLGLPLGFLLSFRRVTVRNLPDDLNDLKAKQEREFVRWGDPRAVFLNLIRKRYGVWGGLWRGLLWTLTVRAVASAVAVLVQFLMDEIR